MNCVIRLIWSLFSSETSSRESVTEKWGSLWLGCFAPKVLLPMRLSPLRPPQASTRALGCWVGRPDAVFCRGWGVPPWGSHSPPPFRPRFSAPHPFHVFFFFLLLFSKYIPNLTLLFYHLTCYFFDTIYHHLLPGIYCDGFPSSLFASIIIFLTIYFYTKVERLF